MVLAAKSNKHRVLATCMRSKGQSSKLCRWGGEGKKWGGDLLVVMVRFGN